MEASPSSAARGASTRRRLWVGAGLAVVAAGAVALILHSDLLRAKTEPKPVTLQFAPGEDRKTLGLDGTETFDIVGVADLKPRQDVEVRLTKADGATSTFTARCRIDTVNELDYFRAGGILQYVLRNLAA